LIKELGFNNLSEFFREIEISKLKDTYRDYIFTMEPTIRKPTEEEKKDASSWPIWEKEVSEFPWEYDMEETCLILEGEVTVINEDGREFHFGKGDYVIFPEGMKCTWRITKNVKKHYKLG